MTQSLPQDFATLAQQRHSCRAFSPQALPRAQIEQLLALAQRAPSDCNTQSWQTLIISGPALERLRNALLQHVAGGGAMSSDLAPIAQYEGAMLERRRACGWALYDAVGVQKGDRIASQKQALENFRLFGAPHMALITAPRSMGERGTLDAGIYLAYFLLAAESLGLGAVPQAAISLYADVLRQEIDIAHDQRIVCAVSFGQKLPDHPANSFRTSRAGQAEYARFIDTV